MGWLKALAIGVAVIVAIGMISAILHLVQLAIVAIAIGAVVALALKARSRLRAGRKEKTPAVEADRAQPELAAGHLDVRAQAASRQQEAARLNQDVEDELARLKRELG
jgi:membrane protein implicated in regulation of membrane protease activity